MPSLAPSQPRAHRPVRSRPIPGGRGDWRPSPWLGPQLTRPQPRYDSSDPCCPPILPHEPTCVSRILSLFCLYLHVFCQALACSRNHRTPAEGRSRQRFVLSRWIWDARCVTVRLPSSVHWPPFAPLGDDTFFRPTNPGILIIPEIPGIRWLSRRRRPCGGCPSERSTCVTLTARSPRVLSVRLCRAPRLPGADNQQPGAGALVTPPPRIAAGAGVWPRPTNGSPAAIPETSMPPRPGC